MVIQRGPTKSRNGETRNGKREMGNGKWETGNGIVYHTDKPFFYAFYADWRSRLNEQLEWKLNPNPNTNIKVVRAGPKYRFRRSVLARVANCERLSPALTEL